MESTDALPIPAGSGAEGDVQTSNEAPSSIEGHDTTDRLSPHEDHAQRHITVLLVSWDGYLNPH